MAEMRPATAEDVLAVAKQPLPRTGKTYTITFDGEPLAVVGYYFDQGTVVIYSKIDERAKVKSEFYAWDLVKFGRQIIVEAQKLGMPIYAAADRNIEGSDKLLKYLGFQQSDNGAFIWQIPSPG